MKTVTISLFLRYTSHSTVANILDYNIVVSEFEPQSLYFVCFRTNTLRKSINFFTLPFIG